MLQQSKFALWEEIERAMTAALVSTLFRVKKLQERDIMGSQIRHSLRCKDGAGER